VSLIWYRRRLSVEDTSFDRTIYAATWLTLPHSSPQRIPRACSTLPSFFAQALMVLGYIVALGGALLDNARLFEQVHIWPLAILLYRPGQLSQASRCP